MIERGFTIKCLDHGYVKLIDYMGSDESFVEAARMSTGKGFLGWFWEEDTYADVVCTNCRTQHIEDTLPWTEDDVEAEQEPICTNCWKTDIKRIDKLKEWLPGPAAPKELTEPKLMGKKGQPRDIALLKTLYANKHSTPFEMGEICIETMVPITVIREWQRHRTQSYNEFSGRYATMPNLHYTPERWRIQKQSTANKQGSAESLPYDQSEEIIHSMLDDQDQIYTSYERYLEKGVSREVARFNTPGSRYTKMRAKANVRNWLAFLALRLEKSAQYEIQVFAKAVAKIIKELFPYTYGLFVEHDLMGTNFSNSEMKIIRSIIEMQSNSSDIDYFAALFASASGMDRKKFDTLMKKLKENKEEEYKDVV